MLRRYTEDIRILEMEFQRFSDVYWLYVQFASNNTGSFYSCKESNTIYTLLACEIEIVLLQPAKG